MQILETDTKKYKISIKGYHSRTPEILRYVADFVIFALMPVGNVLLASLPGIDEKVWLMFGWTTFCALFKLTTKFISEFPKET
jgi:hypothetical protein